MPVFISKESSFSEALKQFLIFSARIPLNHMHRSTIWKGGENHYDQFKDASYAPDALEIYGDIFGCHEDWGPLLAFDE